MKSFQVYLFTVNRKGISSKGINFFMKIHGFLSGKGHKPAGSHTEVIFFEERINRHGRQVKIMAAGSVKTGGEMRPLSEAIKEKWINWRIFKPAFTLTREQYDKMFATAQKYTMGAIKCKYPYINFWSWIRWIFSGTWSGEYGEEYQNCWELSVRILRGGWEGFCALVKSFKDPIDRNERTPAEHLDIFDITNSSFLTPVDSKEEMQLLNYLTKGVIDD